MKTILNLLLFFYVCTSWSQPLGKWEIVKCYPEVTGFSEEELHEFAESCLGERVSINKNIIHFADTNIEGELDDNPKWFDIMDNSKVADSLNMYLRYPCQEISYLNLVTTQSINLINKDYRNGSIKVYSFRCAQRRETMCCFIYFFSDDKICLCIPGDGFYILNRIN
ncbi:MAG TPA: hypothetical protein VGB50_11825 [Flavobacterium sp.]|jgi:hypothetical protein